MRTFLGVGIVLGLACGAAIAQEKIDAKKLIGKWESKPDAKEKFVVEFTKDGKITLTLKDKSKENKVEGTYKLEGNKLTLILKAEGKEVTMKRTISKLTDKEVTSKDDDTGVEDSIVRVVEKGKDK